MLISYSHKFIFFHVAKVAGLSIRDALKDYVQEPEKFKIRRPPKISNGKPNPLYEMWQSALLHAKAEDVKKELPADLYNGSYKFAFVRNPWDWQVSMYHFILKEHSHTRHELVKSMGGFEQYLEWIVQTDRPYARGATKFQKDMITDGDGNLIIDFIGRYERLEDDFAHICKVAEIKAELPKLNRTIHRDYRSYYNEKTKKIVSDHFRADIELLHYTF